MDDRHSCASSGNNDIINCDDRRYYYGSIDSTGEENRFSFFLFFPFVSFFRDSRDESEFDGPGEQVIIGMYN